MNRIWLLSLALAATGAISALAVAQTIPNGQAEAPSGADPIAPEIAAAQVATPAHEADSQQASDRADTAPVRHDFVDLRRIRPITGDIAAGQAKSASCVACHGANGVALSPAFPNLAGQRADFIYWQLVEFKRGTLVASPMNKLAMPLSEQDMRDVAVYYASLPGANAASTLPAPDPALSARGEALYTNGDPNKGIPPCQGCHGADANGHPQAAVPDRNGYVPYAVYPALRRQQGIYLSTKLAAYRTSNLHDSSTDYIMHNVAVRLGDDDIQALSAWLSQLPN